jgi:hypothetical protein
MPKNVDTRIPTYCTQHKNVRKIVLGKTVLLLENDLERKRLINLKRIGDKGLKKKKQFFIQHTVMVAII